MNTWFIVGGAVWVLLVVLILGLNYGAHKGDDDDDSL